MRVLMHLNDLSIGGSQMNAVDLARGLRERGVDVHMSAASPPGPLVRVIEAEGLPLERLTRDRVEPGGAAAPLRDLAADIGADLVHTFEWQQALDALRGPYLADGTPMVSTVMTMSVPRWLPARRPLTTGTPALTELARRHHRGPVWTLPPPVDVRRDRPAVAHAFRRNLGVAEDQPLVVMVSRIVPTMKLESILDAADAVAVLGQGVALAVVGTGPGLRCVHERATELNRLADATLVHVVGELVDARPAYAAADVVIGMGGSAIRALAHGKPTIVAGTRGFAATVDEVSLPWFRHHGFYGVGTSNPGASLRRELGRLLGDRSRRAELGEWGRGIVVQEYSLEHCMDILGEVYDHAVRAPRPDARERRLESQRVTVHRAAADVTPAPLRRVVRRAVAATASHRHMPDVVAGGVG